MSLVASTVAWLFTYSRSFTGDWTTLIRQMMMSAVTMLSSVTGWSNTVRYIPTEYKPQGPLHYNYEDTLWQLLLHQLALARLATRRGQGGRLTTLNFRTGAVTTLNFFHAWIFLWSNISRKQTRQYRKSTTTTSILPVRCGAVNKWRHESIMDINKIYHSFGQHCLSCRRPRDLIFS